MKKLLFIICLLYSRGSIAQMHSKESIKDAAYLKAIDRAEKYLDSLRKVQGIPGLSVCIGSSKKLIWAEGFGYADLENLVPVSVYSKFRMGSVSKSITSIAVGRLIQEKLLDPDAPIQLYVPQWQSTRGNVTARQLATHTAGIRHYKSTDQLSVPKRYKTVQESLGIFISDSLLFRPGSSFNYSTYGYSLLSAVIEGASHMDYLSYLQRKVFLPLGMTQTGADFSDSVVINRVRFYERGSFGVVNAAQVDNSYKWAGGGLLSTPIDLVKLSQGFFNHIVLGKETVSLLFKPQILPDQKNTYYGFGWRIGVGSRGKKIIHHGGLIDGGRTFLLLYPDEEIAIAITANISGAQINVSEAETIANFFFDIKP